MSVVAFVPARSGSKRTPNKNIRLLGGKPLVVWTLEACVNAKGIDRVIFSTDSDEYREVVKKWIQSDKLEFHDRTNEEAGDKVKIFDYMKEHASEIFSSEDDSFLLALPTMPTRNSRHVDEAVEIFLEKGKPVFAAMEYDFAVSFAFTMTESGEWDPVFQDSPMVTGNTRSQDQQQCFHPNGALYIRKVKDLNEESLKTFYQGGIPYIMDSSSCIDIDTEQDFALAEAVISVS